MATGIAVGCITITTIGVITTGVTTTTIGVIGIITITGVTITITDTGEARSALTMSLRGGAGS